MGAFNPSHPAGIRVSSTSYTGRTSPDLCKCVCVCVCARAMVLISIMLQLRGSTPTILSLLQTINSMFKRYSRPPWWAGGHGSCHGTLPQRNNTHIACVCACPTTPHSPSPHIAGHARGRVGAGGWNGCSPGMRLILCRDRASGNMCKERYYRITAMNKPHQIRRGRLVVDTKHRRCVRIANCPATGVYSTQSGLACAS